MLLSLFSAHSIPRPQSAQALVEFALVAPLLAMMLMGATDLTRAFYTYVVLSNASREAARVIIDYPYQYSDTAACTAGHNEGLPLYSLNCGGGSPTLIISPAANTGVTPPERLPGRNTVTVTAKTDFKPITVLIQWFMGSTITIQAQTTYVTWY